MPSNDPNLDEFLQALETLEAKQHTTRFSAKDFADIAEPFGYRLDELQTIAESSHKEGLILAKYNHYTQALGPLRIAARLVPWCVNYSIVYARTLLQTNIEAHRTEAERILLLRIEQGETSEEIAQLLVQVKHYGASAKDAQYKHWQKEKHLRRERNERIVAVVAVLSIVASIASGIYYIVNDHGHDVDLQIESHMGHHVEISNVKLHCHRSRNAGEYLELSADVLNLSAGRITGIFAQLQWGQRHTEFHLMSAYHRTPFSVFEHGLPQRDQVLVNQGQRHFEGKIMDSCPSDLYTARLVLDASNN